MRVGKNHVMAIGFLAIVSLISFGMGSLPAIAQSSTSSTTSSGVMCCCCLAVIIIPIIVVIVFIYMKVSSQNKALADIKESKESQDPARIDELVNMLNSPDTSIQNNSASALQGYRMEYLGVILGSIVKSHRNIIKAVANPKRPVDINVFTVYGINNIPIRTVTVDLGPSTIDTLISLLNSDNEALRGAIVRVLIEFGSVGVEPLIAALNSPDKNIRVNALHVLGEIKDIRATDPVMSALKDEDIDVRNAAASALKGFNITAVPKERETIKEIVKVPCQYCGTLVEVTAPKCPSCGAPFKR